MPDRIASRRYRKIACRVGAALTLALTFAAPLARAQGNDGWITIVSRKAVFPASNSESSPVVFPFSIPAGKILVRFTFTQNPYRPESFGYSGVGVPYQWGGGATQPPYFVGSFSDVCTLPSRPGGGRSPSPPVFGADHIEVLYRHNDLGKPCTNLWAAIYPAVRTVNGRAVAQSAATVGLTIEYKVDPPTGDTPIPPFNPPPNTTTPVKPPTPIVPTPPNPPASAGKNIALGKPASQS